MTNMTQDNTLQPDQYYIDALRYAESVRDLDPNTALKIAMILSCTHPELYSRCVHIAKKQNLVPKSTLQLIPVPSVPASSNK